MLLVSGVTGTPLTLTVPKIPFPVVRPANTSRRVDFPAEESQT